ncbi:cytosolic endo-beta-N-acetylglucosaminidase [Anopheles arabiensis]|uniref:Cytosolic endo-beta-N-acetylglucosaminidase TIM barrel domain-containing protein n=1 Tax=Anopheles arabiensis TaxID=7173 RepID=A0A182IAH4_ANOAR|nr:cytosolic endo-beta-N-acetylglucosaminidase [Anopheles arabiensis]
MEEEKTDCDSAHAQMCQPILTLQALLDFDQGPHPWKNLVEPIAPRSRSRHLGDRYQVLEFADGPVTQVANESRPQVLLCHDFKGNYLNDRYINGVQGEERWVDYRFYNWAAIDIFCYFSHHFVTVPTLQWLNCAHRNGVKVIGTLIVEQKNVQLLRDILQSEEFMRRVVEALVTVSKVCQFHGWLLNVECGLETGKVGLLRDFVQLLTERCHAEIPGSLVIWYDAIAKTGRLEWQNELNSANDAFFLACDGIFLNYAWDRQKLERTESYIRNYCPDRRLDVYVGIDVFGRSQKAQMDTHAPLEQVLSFPFSVALFAPGWTFESLEESSRRDRLEPDDRNVLFLQMNDRFWNRLWRHLYVRGPVQLPFYSSFCLGSGKFYNRLGRTQSAECWFNLAKQHFQPTIPYTPPLEYDTRTDPLAHWTHHFDGALDGGSCLKLRNDARDKRLFACDFPCDDDLIVCYAHRRSNPTAIDLGLVLKAYCGRRHECLRIVCANADCHVGERSNEVRALPLDKEQSLQLLKLGATSQLPLADTVNGWDIRYYYLSAERLPVGIRIVDIGIKLHKEPDAHENDHALLGAIHLQAGIPAHRDRLLQRTVLVFDRPE